MTMEEWVLFITQISCLVLHDTGVPANVLQLWAPLQRALTYFLSYRPGQHHHVAWDGAQNDLLQYARLAEEMFRMHKLLTVQLHSAVVHLVESVEQCGPSAFRCEWWVERMCQLLKRMTKYRTGRSPEATAAKNLQIGITCNTTESQCPEVMRILSRTDPNRKMECRGADDFDEAGDCMTGAGAKCDGATVRLLGLSIRLMLKKL
jgi:hypothetical protein